MHETGRNTCLCSAEICYFYSCVHICNRWYAFPMYIILFAIISTKTNDRKPHRIWPDRPHMHDETYILKSNYDNLMKYIFTYLYLCVHIRNYLIQNTHIHIHTKHSHPFVAHTHKQTQTIAQYVRSILHLQDILACIAQRSQRIKCSRKYDGQLN